MSGIIINPYAYAETGLDPEAFVTEWTIPGGASAADRTIKLCSFNGHILAGMNYNVDWGDGSSDSGVALPDKTHEYPANGSDVIYQVVITGQFGSLNMFRATTANRDALTKMVQWGTDNAWSSIWNMFYECTNMLYEATDAPNLTTLTESTDAQRLFYLCEDIETMDVSNWNTSNITGLYQAFSGLKNCTSLNVSDWNIPNVTTAYGIFGALGQTVTECALDCSNWTLGSITTLQAAWRDANTLSLDLSGWDFGGSSPDVVMETFGHSWELNGTTLDLSSWTNFSASSLLKAFRGSTITSLNITNWDTSNCTTFQEMFYGNNSIEQIVGLNELNSTSVTGTGLIYMFYGTVKLSFTGAANNFSTAWGLGLGNCTSTTYMFINSGRTRVSPGDPPNVGNWDLSGVTVFQDMFSYTQFNAAPDIESWDVSSATSFQRFMGHSNFTVNYAYDLSNWNFTNSLTTVHEMFRECHNQVSGTGLTSLEFDSANCNFGGVTAFGPFVYRCLYLTSLKFTGATDFSSATNFSYFAYQCYDLINLDLGTVQNFNSSTNNWVGFGAYWTTGIASVDFLTTANIPATTGLSSMFTGSQIATADYDNLLIALDAVGNSNGNLNAGSSTYSVAAATARGDLVIDGWTIADGGAA